MKMPAGWLRDRRWEDEQVTTHSPEQKPPAYDRGTNSARSFEAPQLTTIPRPPTDAEYRSRMCSEPGHDEYPLPCESCKRRVGLSKNVSF
jgi:hypothetical protein